MQPQTPQILSRMIIRLVSTPIVYGDDFGPTLKSENGSMASVGIAQREISGMRETLNSTPGGAREGNIKKMDGLIMMTIPSNTVPLRM